MAFLGWILLALGLWAALHQKERAYQRRMPLGIPAFDTYRQDLLARLIDGALRGVAVLLSLAGLAVLVSVYEPTLGILVATVLFSLLLWAVIWA